MKRVFAFLVIAFMAFLAINAPPSLASSGHLDVNGSTSVISGGVVAQAGEFATIMNDRNVASFLTISSSGASSFSAFSANTGTTTFTVRSTTQSGTDTYTAASRILTFNGDLTLATSVDTAGAPSTVSATVVDSDANGNTNDVRDGNSLAHASTFVTVAGSATVSATLDAIMSAISWQASDVDRGTSSTVATSDFAVSGVFLGDCFGLMPIALLE